MTNSRIWISWSMEGCSLSLGNGNSRALPRREKNSYLERRWSNTMNTSTSHKIRLHFLNLSNEWISHISPSDSPKRAHNLATPLSSHCHSTASAVLLCSCSAFKSFTWNAPEGILWLQLMTCIILSRFVPRTDTPKLGVKEPHKICRMTIVLYSEF